MDVYSARPVGNCVESMSAFSKAPTKNSYEIGYGENSLSKQFENYQEFRSQMLALRPSIENYLKEQESLGRRKKVTFSEITEFYFERHEKFIKHIESALGISEDIDRYLLKLINGISMPARKYLAYEKLQENPKLMKRRFNFNDPRQGSFIDSLGINVYKGEIGEFDVAMRMNQIVGHSFQVKHDYVDNAYLNNLKKIIEEAFKSAKKRVSSYSNRALTTKYPHVFKFDHRQTRKEFFEQTYDFIINKEFDLIRFVDGQYQILEVKNLKSPLRTYDLFKGSKKKTPLDQSLEDLEILDFLGIQDRVQFSLVLMRGITTDALEILREKKISVITDVVIEQEAK